MSTSKPKTLSTLIKEAKKASKTHSLKWSKDRTKASAICKKCFSVVFVDSKPAMEGTILGGSAINEECLDNV